MASPTLNPDWSVIYAKAIEDDGSLFFPERLTLEFLQKQKIAMGSYLFANQYQNEIIPIGDQTFPRHWLRYFVSPPENIHTFAFVDPAISLDEMADYTAIVVVQTDEAQNWYVRHARRERINPTELIERLFEICERYNPILVGIEDVAFQRSIIHFAYEEMRRRKKLLPLHGVKRSPDKTKHMRIMSLVPRFEFGTLYLSQGLHDLELELAQYPRGAHDDLIDALSSVGEIATYPVIRRENARPHPGHPDYERWYIEQLRTKGSVGKLNHQFGDEGGTE